MLLFFSGCSITWGDELNDRLNDRFSTLVSNHYNSQHLNISSRGISNDNIVRNTIKYLQNYKPDVIVIQFTVTSRIEYYQVNEEPIKFTPQPTFIPPELKQTHRDYYTKVYNDAVGAENTWKNIFLFDSFCKSRGQKYIPILADHYEPILLRPEKFYKTKEKDGFLSNECIGYWRQLCKDINITLMHYEVLGMDKQNPQHYAQWANGGHPSAKGHKVIANKIIELIDAI
tara:strand:+ start:403 stop:1089 length:687 start_codon:yes stop_codon:yes gene_type:complete